MVSFWLWDSETPFQCFYWSYPTLPIKKESNILVTVLIHKTVHTFNSKSREKSPGLNWTNKSFVKPSKFLKSISKTRKTKKGDKNQIRLKNIDFTFHNSQNLYKFTSKSTCAITLKTPIIPRNIKAKTLNNLP